MSIFRNNCHPNKYTTFYIYTYLDVFEIVSSGIIYIYLYTKVGQNFKRYFLVILYAHKCRKYPFYSNQKDTP